MRKRKRCSFCGMNEAEGGRMVAGPDDVKICSGCLWLCFAIIHKLPTPPSEFTPKVDKKPLTERLAEFYASRDVVR